VKISCPACAAKYSIADEKVHDRLAKIRCRKCGTTIVIDGKTSPPHVYAAEAGTIETSPAAPAHDGGGGGGEYSVDFGDNDQRTMQLSEIVAAYNSGQVTAETFVWAEGMGDWQPLGEVPQIVEALHSAASRPSSAGARQSARPSSPPWDAPRQSDASVARAAARTGGRGAPGGDLFGSFESAGSEEDVTTSAPETAAHQASAGATGARNESSVLFSLSALTAAAKPAPAAAASAGAASSLSSSLTSSLTASRPAAAARDDDDSGLIDLKALTAAAAKSEHENPAPMLGAPPLGVAPLGLAPLGGYGSGVAAQESPLMMPQQKNRTGLFIGAGIAIAAVVIAVAFIMRPTPPPPEASPAAMVTTPPPPPAPTPTPTPEASSPTATPPSTGTAEADKEKPKVAAKGGSYRPRGTGKKPEKSVDAPASKGGGGDAPAPKKTASKCGCASGDLMCHMKCASK
jgi:predicted Zn finger-like uncharacterized protein